MSKIIKQFYQDTADLAQFHRHLKLSPCPHCQRTGYLIKHGFLYGYILDSINRKTRRAVRIFCSNRNRRLGCGKTFSLFSQCIIKRLVVPTHSLWLALHNFLSGFCKIDAFRRADISLSPSSTYRIFRRLHRAQPKTRPCLINIRRPPDPDPHLTAFQLTIRHFKNAFPSSNDPLADFQFHFQTGII